jgi:Fe-S-cluster-containing hydrogenase component 2
MDNIWWSFSINGKIETVRLCNYFTGGVNLKVLRCKPELCIECHVCENTCSKLYFKEENAEKACIRIGKKDEKQEINTCTQCGVCIDICPVQAIKRDKNGIVRIDKKVCVGCFMCVGFCPENAMFMHDDYIEPFKCTSCGQCAKNCPTGAIYISEE